MAEKTRMKGRHWGHEETCHLIDIWGAPEMQVSFDTMTRKELLYKQIEAELRKLGFDRSAAQIKEKIHNLKTKYREFSAKINRSGAGDLKIEQSFPFYDAINNVIGKRPASNPSTITDSLIVEECSGANEEGFVEEPSLQDSESFNSGDGSPAPTEDSTSLPGPSSKKKKDPLSQKLETVVDQFLQREEEYFREERKVLEAIQNSTEKRQAEDSEWRAKQEEQMKQDNKRKDKFIGLFEKFLETPSKKKK